MNPPRRGCRWREGGPLVPGQRHDLLVRTPLRNAARALSPSASALLTQSSRALSAHLRAPSRTFRVVSILRKPSPYKGTSVSTWARTSSLPGAAATRLASSHASCEQSEKSVGTTIR